jgi:hypothetical protein
MLQDNVKAGENWPVFYQRDYDKGSFDRDSFDRASFESFAAEINVGKNKVARQNSFGQKSQPQPQHQHKA